MAADFIRNWENSSLYNTLPLRQHVCKELGMPHKDAARHFEVFVSCLDGDDGIDNGTLVHRRLLTATGSEVAQKVTPSNAQVQT